jgi:hypothetical protein
MLINIILLGLVLSNVIILFILSSQRNLISSLFTEQEILRKVILDMRGRLFSKNKTTIH